MIGARTHAANRHTSVQLLQTYYSNRVGTVNARSALPDLIKVVRIRQV